MRPEILAPVGSMEALNAALAAGCDAVYFGLPSFGARAFANNFDLETTKEVIERCHLCGVKAYITMNTILYEDEIEDAYQMAKKVHSFGVDALIIQDLGFIHLLHHRLPNLVLHASTQLSVTNPYQIEQLKKLGVKRVVLARECSKEEIQACVDTGIEVEVFVHGALCICYSGQCYFSSVHYGRSGNRGMCAQPCRMKYTLYEDGNKVDTHGEYVLSPKDLSLIDEVNTLADMGVCSLKIEGRMKSAYYLATVVSSYRMLIDYIYEHGHADVEIIERVKKEIAKAENRPTGPGFYNGLPGYKVQLYQDHDETVTQEYVAIVQDYDKESQMATLQVKNHFMPNQDLEIFGPHILSTIVHVGDVYDSEDNVLEVCNKPMQIVHTKWSGPIEVDAMIRKIR